MPSTLVALLVVSGGAYALGLDYRPIAAIPSGLTLPQWGLFATFGIDTLTQYLFTAMTLALLGAIDSLLTSVVADNMTKTVHEPNKELVGQGIGNSFVHSSAEFLVQEQPLEQSSILTLVGKPNFLE